MYRALVLGAGLAQGAVGAATGCFQMLPRAQNSSLAPSKDRWPGGLHLAVDYYPSQWPEFMWEPDVARMRDANISYVRVSEFDWAVLEPTEGNYNFTLLDKTLELFEKYGLKAIVGTPTAGPPNWLTEKYDVDFVDRTNATLQFGSRRHYSFSSFDYRVKSQKITQKMAERYGTSSTVVGWQLDNEFGCHDTVRSYDHNAITRFRTWLKEKYGTIEAMNDAQGRVFWSQGYENFEAVQPPFLEVYTNNYAHTLDWYTFSSDMVIDFAKEQASILKQYAPTHAVTTNLMMSYTDFDHYKFAREVGIDFATFDEYPLAAPSQFSWLSDTELADYLRTGLPDYQALHHALYRGIAGAAYNATAGPFGVMEMEPGVLNWNNYRVSPIEGMVRLWTHETFAESGDLVNYFRWRQVPYAQEQTLSGLFLSDNTEDGGFVEQQVMANEDLPKLREAGSGDALEPQRDVALVFDYASHWVWAIEPYSGSWDVKQAGYTSPTLKYFDLVYTFYSSLRRLGLSVDVIGPDQPLDGYKMVVVPSLPIIPDTFDSALSSYTGPVVVGPHTGSKTPDFAAAPGLNPSAGALREKLPMRVTRVETPPEYALSAVSYNGTTYNISAWEETIVCSRDNATSTASITSGSRHRKGKPAACTKDGAHYLAFSPPADLLVAYLGDVAAGAGIKDLAGRTPGVQNDLGATMRLAKRGDLLWAFNYGVEEAAAPEVEGELLIGEAGDVPAAGVVVWKV
ncbi:beta-galactosidase-domain-containing protein [Pseudomassariella vexata]|uniref:beta-galactosidase n=1 Tax=Pseudomassariella vexata TaxID=1141098 RepID=A0A1Y2DIC1_9PEZI|nr:beta-galactosidase-domain-containing protein [Pseudomassariella vexata]ORY58555.1 beta-galactosidase-domain-containing protein [Pseudomassariella vexata]